MSPLPTFDEFIKQFEDIAMFPRNIIRILKIRKIWKKHDQKS